MRILAICGSLREHSSNKSALQAAKLLAPSDIEVALFDGIGGLPYFNPDLDDDNPPTAVQAFRHDVGAADGLIISSPEYAHGVSGSMKNALDWLVGSFEFPGKPVALWSTSQRSFHANSQMREILLTMSAKFAEDASITLPLMGRKLDSQGIASDQDLSDQICKALLSFRAMIEEVNSSNEK